MRRPLLAALAAGLLVPAVLLSGAPALAHPTGVLEPTLPTDLTFKATDNVEYLGRFPEHAGTAGGFPSEDGKVFYLTDPRGVYTYDTTDPENPVRLDSVTLYQQTVGAVLAQEDPDTDGSILLVDGAASPRGTAELHVVDVSDPKDLKVLSKVAVTDHTWTCVTEGTNGCAYAYGRTGHIVDLRKPTEPKVLDKSWRSQVQFGDKSNSPYAHDLTEVRPGLVMSAGSINVLMDTRNPAKPVLLNKLDQGTRFTSLGYHSAEWARGGEDDLLVLGTEIGPSPVPGGPPETQNVGGSDCEGQNSVIETWSARGVLPALRAYYDGVPGALAEVRKATFEKVGTFDAGSRGIFLTGAAPANVLYCAHWMEKHPDWQDGGLLTVSYYDRGTRFVRVAGDGTMEEIGWIVAAEGYSGSSQWISDEVVYVMDYRRGLEVVKLDTSKRATAVQRTDEDVIALSSLTLASQEQRGAALPLAAGGLLALLLVNVGVLRRRARA